MLLQLLIPLAVAAAAAFAPHPHHPKAVKLQGAQGMVTLTYFTVDFNPAHLAELKPGFDWHIGYANLNTAVDLKCGDVSVGKGEYKLNVRRGETPDTWTGVLVPLSLARARQAVRAAARKGAEAEQEARAALDALLADMKQKNLPTELSLPIAKFDAAKADHLACYGIHYGYDAVERGSDKPAGGAELGFRVSFGDLHREVKFNEVFAAPAK